MSEQGPTMPSDTDLTNRVERLELFEERCGVRIEGLYAYVGGDGDCVVIMGEIHARSGDTLEHSIEVVAAVYDSSLRVIARDHHCVDEDKFFGFDTFEMIIEVPASRITKMRLYPKKW